MGTVGVHKQKPILKLGYCMRVTLIKEMQPHDLVNTSTSFLFVLSRPTWGQFFLDLSRGSSIEDICVTKHNLVLVG